MTTDQRVAALEHEVEEMKAEIDRLFSTLFRLLTMSPMPTPERFALLEILGLDDKRHPVDPR